MFSDELTTCRFFRTASYDAQSYRTRSSCMKFGVTAICGHHTRSGGVVGLIFGSCLGCRRGVMTGPDSDYRIMDTVTCAKVT